MRRIPLAAAAASLACQTACAQVTAPSVCRAPEVLARLSDLVNQPGRRVDLDAASAGEQSAGPDRTVSCAVRGQIYGYETNRYGMQPVDAPFVVHYTLDLRQNGIFLRMLPVKIQ